MTATRTGLRADLHRLPDVSLAQLHGGDWRPKYRARRADMDAWIVALRDAGFRYSPTAIYNEPVRLGVKVYYPTASVPDIDNVTAAIKPLIDLLEHCRPVGRGMRGYVGWVTNDRLIASVTVERFTDASRAPLTSIRMEAMG